MSEITRHGDDDEYESFTLSGRKRGASEAPLRDRPESDVVDDDLDDDELEDDEDDLDDDLDDDDDEDVDDHAEGDDDEDDEDDEDDYEDLEDAVNDEIDLVIAVYREDGEGVAQALAKDLANDLDELVDELRRQPADAGAIGFVSLVEEVFVIVRVRGRNVQALLSDAAAASDWPIARDVADFLGIDEIPDPDEDTVPMGDLGILSDLGISEFQMDAICENLDESSDELLTQIADKLKVGPVFRKAMDTFE